MDSEDIVAFLAFAVGVVICLIAAYALGVQA